MPNTRLFLYGLLLFAAPGWAYAYLDPATGSMILQAVIAAAAGAVIVLRNYWHRIVGFFGGKRSKSHDLDD